MADKNVQLALGDEAARQLANATKTVPQMLTITPRWLTRLMPWVGVEAGIYRLNKVKDESRVLVVSGPDGAEGGARRRRDGRPRAVLGDG